MFVKLSKLLKTQRMAFFELCSRDNFNKTLLYPKVPTYFTLPNGKLCRRKQEEAVAEFPGIKKQTL